MQKRFQRPLSSAERLWLGLENVVPSNLSVFQTIMEGFGSVDFDHIQAAVAKASQANPGTRLILKGALRWAHWVDSGINPRVRRVAGEAWSGYHPDGASFLYDRLPYGGPTCEVVQVEGPIPRLVFRTNHAVMDGRGMYTWVQDIFRVLRGEEPLGACSSLTEGRLMSSITDKTKLYPPGDCIAPTGKPRPSLPGTTWRRLSFKGPVSNILGQLGWALAQSAWQYHDGIVRLMIPVDLRFRKPGLRSTGNLTMSLYVDVTRDSCPESIKQDIQAQIEGKYDCMSFKQTVSINGDYIPIKLMGIGMRWMAEKSETTGRYGATALVSNLGSADMQTYCGGGVYTETTFTIPPSWDIYPVFIVLSGSKDRVEIIVSVLNSLATDNRLERLLQGIRQTIAPHQSHDTAIPVSSQRLS